MMRNETEHCSSPYYSFIIDCYMIPVKLQLLAYYEVRAEYSDNLCIFATSLTR